MLYVCFSIFSFIPNFDYATTGSGSDETQTSGPSSDPNSQEITINQHATPDSLALSRTTVPPAKSIYDIAPSTVY